MARFVEIGKSHINVNEIRSFYFDADKDLCIKDREGRTHTISVGSPEFYEEELSGARHIVQAFPNSANAWIVWKEDNGTHSAVRADVLALCADGVIRAVTLHDGYFDFPEECTNYEGLYREDQLSAFSNLEKSGEAPV